MPEAEPHPSPALAPRSHRVAANGMTHHALEWSPLRGGGRTVLLLHGIMDAAGTWDLVAPELAAAGHRVIAPDFRGFGESPRVPSGGYYHFPDYVADLAGIARSLLGDEAEVAVVGHSMGGTVATYFTGTFPERVTRLAVLEGAGPPDNPFEIGPDRMKRWILDLRKAEKQPSETPLASEDDAFKRLRVAHPAVSDEVLRSRIPHLTRVNESGTLVWRYDPLHRSTSPFPFFAGTWRAFAARATCPVLYVSGGPTGYHAPDEAERISSFKTLRTVVLDEGGHMMHWTKPRELARALLEHLAP